MKSALIFVSLLFCSDVFGQSDIALSELYFTRQPSPLSESLGKGGVALPGNNYSWFYNPALLGSVDRITIAGSYTDPDFYVIDAEYNSFSLSVPLSQRFALGFGRFYLDWKIGAHSALYAASVSYQPFTDVFVGVTLNYVQDHWTSSYEAHSFPVDLGVSKIWKFTSLSTSHVVVAGLSYRNAFESKLRYPNQDGIIIDSLPFSFQNTFDLPIIQAIGISHTITTNRKFFDLHAASWLLMADYTNVRDTKYFGGYHLGTDLTILEILSVRCGYYREKNYIAKYEEGPTYGLGIQLPIYKISDNRIPFLVSMSHTRFSWGGDNSRKLTAWSLSIDWNRQ